MKKPKPRITITFAKDIQWSLLEDQGAFQVHWHEPKSPSLWRDYISEIFLLEIALKRETSLNEIITNWPDLAWLEKGPSTLRRWLSKARDNFDRLPANLKQDLRAKARWQINRQPMDQK